MEMTLSQAVNIQNGDDGRGKLYFYGDIVDSWWGAWDDTTQYPEAVRTFLDNQDGAIDIFVNSAGGNAFACSAIYNMLRRYQHEKCCYIDGLAASAASVIVLAADRIVMPANAMLMIHRAWSACCGNAEELEGIARSLKSIDEGMAATYAEHSGKSMEEILSMMSAETWMNGMEASQFFSKIELSEAVSAVCRADKATLQHFQKMPEAVARAINVSDSDTQNKRERLQAAINLLDMERRIF